MIKIFTNTVTRKNYNENGDLFRDGLPNIFMNGTDTVQWQLCSSTPDIASETQGTPEDWPKCTDYASFNAIGAFLTADDDYVKRMKGTLAADVPSGSVASISASVPGATLATIPQGGTVTLYNSSGDMETVEFTAVAVANENVQFTIATGTTLEHSYASGNAMDCVQSVLMQASLDTVNSDVANGLFVFTITANSRKLHDRMAYANTRQADVMGLELAIFNVDSENSTVVDLERYEVDTFSIRSGIADTSMDAQVTPQRESEAVTVMKTLLASGMELQFSANGTDWHAEQSTAEATLDKYYRFRLAGSGGTWSSAVRLLDGSSEKSKKWAEGTDEEVEDLGGEHSSKGWAEVSGAIRDEILTLVSHHFVGPATDYGVTQNGTVLSFTWTDPADNDVVRWKKTRLIYKQGGFPANENDGTVLVDNTVHNQYQTTPFTFDMLAVSDYYFALFTQTTGDVWNTGDDSPRFTTDTLTWQAIVMMSRAGTLLQYPGMAIGAVVDIQTNSLFPKLRWKLAHIDYMGNFENVSDYMLDNTINHNSIWIPDKLPCLGESNTAMQVQFDAPETAYGATWDTVFLDGKAYYTVSGETYTQLTVGTDYEVGDSIADWQTQHGDTVYTKNHADRVAYGYNSWKESNIRQGLNKKGTDLFVPQNEYDVKSSDSFYSTGFLAGFSDGYLAHVQKVRNRTARNTISVNSAGGGGGYDVTLDQFWLPSMKEVYNSNTNSIPEGSQFAYFRDVANTNALKIQYDEGTTARNTWLRSPFTSTVRSEYYINTSGGSNNHFTSSQYALLPVQCIA